MWLVAAVAFFTGLYLGFAHGRRGTLDMATAWYLEADGEGRAVRAAGGSAEKTRAYQLMRRCATDAELLGHLW